MEFTEAEIWPVKRQGEGKLWVWPKIISQLQDADLASS